MFDVGDLPVLTFGNCVLNTGVIKWPLKLYGRFFTFLTFFSKSKNMTFYVFLSCCTRFLEHWLEKGGRSKRPHVLHRYVQSGIIAQVQTL